MLMATTHAFIVRRRVWRLDYVPPIIARQRAALREAADAEQLRRVARELVTSDPRRALELQVGRPDIPDRGFPDGGLVAVNNAPEEALRVHVGLSRGAARAIADRRQVGQGFGSAAEVSVLLGLPPHLFESVADRIVFLPRPVSDAAWKGHDDRG